MYNRHNNNRKRYTPTKNCSKLLLARELYICAMEADRANSTFGGLVFIQAAAVEITIVITRVFY
jgi:hypothetical protein